MDDPPANDAEPSEHQGGARRQLPIGRAAVVLALFVLATVLLLGRIHQTPTTPAAAGSPQGSSTTTTIHQAGSTTTTAPRPPTNVPVLTANASGVTGAAATISDRLQADGWTVQAPTNATTNQATSHVYYVAGQEAAAKAVASALRLPASEVLPYTTAAPVGSIGTAEIVVVVAPDLASGTGTTTTTTTVH